MGLLVSSLVDSLVKSGVDSRVGFTPSFFPHPTDTYYTLTISWLLHVHTKRPEELIVLVMVICECVVKSTVSMNPTLLIQSNFKD